MKSNNYIFVKFSFSCHLFLKYFFVTLGKFKLFYSLAGVKQFFLLPAGKIKQLDFCSRDENYRMHLGPTALARAEKTSNFLSRDLNSL